MFAVDGAGGAQGGGAASDGVTALKILAGLMIGPNGPTVVNFAHITLQFKLQDMWIGVYWRDDSTMSEVDYSVWVCLLPMLPICINRVRRR